MNVIRILQTGIEAIEASERVRDALRAKIEEDRELLAFVKMWAGEMTDGLPEEERVRFWKIYETWLAKQNVRERINQ
jgi:hypothetical protein